MRVRGSRVVAGCAAGAAAFAVAACYRGYAVQGRLVASDGNRGVQCDVRVAEPSHVEGAGGECSSPEFPPGDVRPWIVPTGSGFRCVVGYDAQVQQLRVRCPGYAPVDHPFAGCDSDCDDVVLGVVVVDPLP